MSRYSRAAALISATAAAAGMAIGTGPPAVGSPRPAPVPLAGSVAPFTAHSRVTGDVAGSARLTLQVWLVPQVAAAERFGTAVSTPGSPSFHHYLSPDAYTARFGPSRADAAAVTSWLRSRGFTAISTDPQRSYVRATATTASIEAAFGTRLRYYRAAGRTNAGPYRLRANDGPVRIPAALKGGILGVTGLDNAAPLRPLDGPHGARGARTAAGATAAGATAATAPDQGAGVPVRLLRDPVPDHHGQPDPGDGWLPRPGHAAGVRQHDRCRRPRHGPFRRRAARARALGARPPRPLTAQRARRPGPWPAGRMRP